MHKHLDSMFDCAVVVFRPRDGENRVRVLPPTRKNARRFGSDVHVHYGIGPDNASYLSLHKHNKGVCPLWRRYQRAKWMYGIRYARKYRPVCRRAFYVIDRYDEARGPQIWLASKWAVFDELEEICDGYVEGIGALCDADGAFDVAFEKWGAGKSTKYSYMNIVKRLTPLHSDATVQERWMAYVRKHPIPKMLKFYPSDHIVSVLNSKSIEQVRLPISPT